MRDPEEVKRALKDLQRDRDKAEALAEVARERLLKAAAGVLPLEDLNATEIEGAADDFATAVRQIQMIDQMGQRARLLFGA